MEVDPDALADSETVLQLHRAAAALEALAARATARWDTKKEWAVDGAKSGGAWLAAKTHASRQEMNRRLRLGRAIRCMPHTEQAWLAGSITSSHVSALAACRRSESLAAQFVDDEERLVAKAPQRSFRRFEQDLAYWRLEHDRDDEEKRARRQVEGRQLYLSPGFQGTWVLNGELDPINGTIVHDTLGSIERELFEQDWKEARATLGREPIAAELQRTPAQRRADALVEMAIRSRTNPKDARRPEPLFTVVMGLPRFEQLSELASRTVVTPGSLVPWFDQAWVERMCSGRVPGCSTWGCSAACSMAPPAGRSRCVTRTRASTTCATSPSGRSTTSSPPVGAARPSRPTAEAPAPSTTANATAEGHPASAATRRRRPAPERREDPSLVRRTGVPDNASYPREQGSKG